MTGGRALSPQPRRLFRLFRNWQAAARLFSSHQQRLPGQRLQQEPQLKTAAEMASGAAGSLGKDAARAASSAGYEGYDHYLRSKYQKLYQQQEGSVAKCSTIFQGLSIYVNGWTDTPLLTMKELIISHGGVFEQEYTGNATHMIATTLSDASIKRLHHGRELIVRPEWITDSITAKTLLPIQPYRLYADLNAGQRRIEFAPKAPPSKLADNDGANDGAYDDAHDEPSQGIIDLFDADQGANSECSTEGDMMVADDKGARADSDGEDSAAINSNDPNFLQKYYAASRLHHLSMWREELKAFAESLMAQRDTASAEKRGPSSSPKMGGLGGGAPLQGQSGPPVIMHIDLDSFFVSVSLRLHPELQGHPVAITHAANGNKGNEALKDSSSDIAACNYTARSFGIKNGMYTKFALKLCPDLVLLPYNFDEYHQVSMAMYRIVAQFADYMLGVSCDEVYIDATNSLCTSGKSPSSYAESIRAAIYEACGCNASIGISHNMLLARMATRRAKPNGQFHLEEASVDEYMRGQDLSAIPGIGGSILERLSVLGRVETCGDLASHSLDAIQALLGPVLGRTVYSRIRGIDQRSIMEEGGRHRKSVGCDISWGIRFETVPQVHAFIERLSKEVYSKMASLNAAGGRVLVKILKQRPDAGTPHKRLGCGPCDAFNRSRKVGTLSSACLLASTAISLFDALAICPTKVRGVGVFISDLRQSPSAPGTSVLSMLNAHQEKIRSSAPEATDHIQSVLDKLGYDRAVFDELPHDVQNEIISLSAEPPTAVAQPKARSIPPTASAKSKRTLSDFWGCAKGDSAKAPKAEAIALSKDIDRSVFEELPEEIRREIIAECGNKSRESSDRAWMHVEPKEPVNSVAQKAPQPIHESSMTFRGATGHISIMALMRRLLNDYFDGGNDTRRELDGVLKELQLHLVQYLEESSGHLCQVVDYLTICREGYERALRDPLAPFSSNEEGHYNARVQRALREITLALDSAIKKRYAC